MTLRVRGVPPWVNNRLNRKGTRLRLSGRRGWAGQPVVNRLRVRLSEKDGLTQVRFDRMMQASYRVKGTRGSDRIIFGRQAGAITRRAFSRFDFGKDDVRDVFRFTNSTPKDPVVHMQQLRIRNFGRQDVLQLRNIGRTIRRGDLRRDGDRWIIPGLDPQKLFVENVI